MNPKTNRRTAGFTMMEMIIVVVIIGVIAALAIPSFLNYMPKLKAKAEARNIVSQLRVARSMAVAERRPYGVAFDLTNKTVQLFGDTDAPTSLIFSVSDSLVHSDTVGSDVSLVSCTFANNCVIFNSTGAASTSGDLQVVTADGSMLMSVNVLASTGRVRLSEIGAT